MFHSKFKRRGERGSIIFMLLIVVAMFAALGYAVTQSLQTGQGTLDKVSDDKMSLALSELRTTVMDTRLAIQNMVMNGVSVDTIDSSYGAYYPLNTDCTSSACKLYDPAGGGLKLPDFPNMHPELTYLPSNATMWTDHSNGVSWTWFSKKGTTKADLIYHVRVNKTFCNYINRMLGVTADVDSFPTNGMGFLFELQSGSRQALGTTAGGWVPTPPTSTPTDANPSEGCLKTDAASATYYYTVILYAT